MRSVMLTSLNVVHRSGIFPLTFSAGHIHHCIHRWPPQTNRASPANALWTHL